VAARLLDGAAGADVLHTAGIIHPKTVDDFERINVGGTRAVLDAARDAGVRRMVHVSSNSPFGLNPTPQDTFGAEEPYHPYMGYGRSKMAAEQLVRAAHGEGIETTVVRPPWFYGRHQPLRQTRFFTGIRTGRFPLVGDGSNRRSMAHVDNLVDGLVLASLVEGAAGRAYWIADRRPYPMREVVETVRAALRAEGYEVSQRTPRLPKLAGTVAEKLDGVLQARGKYVQELHVLGEMDKTIACRIDAAERDLGYDPQVELLGGMRDAIQWCRAEGIEL
jgi:nucleoside-diphosphate-sugar epimerase